MAKKYVQKLSSFDPYILELFDYVIKNGRFGVEFLSKRELLGERLRIYRFRAAMREERPDDPITKLMDDVEVKYNTDNMVLELLYRPAHKSNLQLALEKAEKGEYTPPTVDDTAKATAGIFADLDKLRAQYGEDDEGKQGNSSE